MNLIAMFVKILAIIPPPIVLGIVAFLTVRLISLISSVWRWVLDNIPIIGG